MSILAQVNIKIPESARVTVLKMGAQLRADPTFVSQLQHLLKSSDDASASPSLAERVAALEEWRAEIEADNP